MVILIRSLTLPGSADGIVYFIKPDFHKLLEIEVWIEAALQVFYSLGPAWGPLITMASYNRFNNNCYRDAVILTLASEGTSIYGGFVVFSVLGFMAHKSNIPIQDVVKSGPGLGFIAYPEALAMLPGSNVWAVLFFFMLLTTGLDSQVPFTHILLMEVICGSATDYFPNLRKKRELFTAIVCAVFFLAGIVVCTQVMLFFTFVTYKPPNYGDYEYPAYAEAFGWLLSFAPVMPLPIVAVKVIKDSPGDTLLEKLKNSTRPSTIWQPVSQEEQKGFTIQDRKYHCGLLGRIKLNILGRS
ncbi:hypothetical protein FSP39_007225 [Pinctada imbricata]|uniref:Uncharacterized protein n=1 Tax=Pinctada imbricata TaxID=66713 RepID=A0AA88YJ10_PINIB|nr:hypothetical protein FSP39_007225 [Pinctada imbricata]